MILSHSQDSKGCNLAEREEKLRRSVQPQCQGGAEGRHPLHLTPFTCLKPPSLYFVAERQPGKAMFLSRDSAVNIIMRESVFGFLPLVGSTKGWQPHVRRKKKLGVICQICRHHMSLCCSTWLSGPLVVPQISSVR